MERQNFSRNRHRLLLLIVVSLLFLTSFYLTKWSLALAETKTWTCFRLIAMPCSTSKECVDFNVSVSSNGQVIFYGNKNTACLGKKIFRLSKDRRMAVRKLIDEYSFSSNSDRKTLMIEMEFSNKQTKVFWSDHQNTAYQKLLSLLTIENLSSYKRWSTLWQMAHRRAAIRSREQKFKRSIDSQWLIIPTASNVYMDDMGWEMSYSVIPPVVQLIRTDGILLENVDENVCFSLEEGLTNFDVVDACLATNNIIAENQFYPLRDERTRIFNTNEQMDTMTVGSSTESLISTAHGATTSQAESGVTLTSTNVVETSTMSTQETEAEQAVSQAENEEGQITDINDPRITAAQEKIDLLPSSSRKSSLQQRLNTVKALVQANHSTTAAPGQLTHASTAPTTIGSFGGTVQTTGGITQAPSEQTQPTTTAAPGQLTHASTAQTTIGSFGGTVQTTGGITQAPSEQTQPTTTSSRTSNRVFESSTGPMVDAISDTNSWSTDSLTSSTSILQTAMMSTTIPEDTSTEPINGNGGG